MDRATINRSRLSFARLCIEIYISKTPVHEIILDLQGREIRQVVKWDRIPLYCQDCKHVGHNSEACYANGQKEKPVRRDYTYQAENGNRNDNERREVKEGGTGDGKKSSLILGETHRQNVSKGMLREQIGSPNNAEDGSEA